MVLPVLGSFLAPALFPAMNPLLMGAVGSGIGSLMQGDDFGDAIKTGLLSFAGGKLLGGLGKGAVDTTAPTAVSGGKQIDPSSFFKNANPPENMFDPFKLLINCSVPKNRIIGKPRCTFQKTLTLPRKYI